MFVLVSNYLVNMQVQCLNPTLPLKQVEIQLLLIYIEQVDVFFCFDECCKRMLVNCSTTEIELDYNDSSAECFSEYLRNDL